MPTNVFTILSHLGQVIAAVAIANLIIKQINFLSFYTIADENYFVPDVGTRKFLLANRKVSHVVGLRPSAPACLSECAVCCGRCRHE